MKHIKAVKEPWRHSSRYKALGQMLVTKQHLDKLAAACIDFKSHGMLNGTCLSEMLQALILMLLDANTTIQGDNEEGEIVDGPTLVQAHIQLAKTIHKIPHI
ncbi:hypothetical protein DFH29DRAFT_877979 [Suillus ampliporus]|nr:hypothetical protein DFH29DRAFT_877979 [Suillus ampliporus]